MLKYTITGIYSTEYAYPSIYDIKDQPIEMYYVGMFDAAVPADPVAPPAAWVVGGRGMVGRARAHSQTAARPRPPWNVWQRVGPKGTQG